MPTRAPSAASLAQDLRAGKCDPVDLVEAVFARNDTVGDTAIFTQTLRERALAEAMAARQRLAAGRPASLLDGVPLAWKDLFDIKGRVTTAGSAVLASAAPAAADAALVAAAKAGGMVTVGCLNMTEFAYSGIGLNPHFGTPRNPHGSGSGGLGPARVPGGSSSACGVAVAQGIVPVAIGTDTGGSVRIPASFNGVVGYKSSIGHYPMGGVFPLSQTLDTLGPLAQSVEDCVLTDAVLRGLPRVAVTASPVSALHILIPQTIVLDDCQPAVRANFEAAIDRLGRAGARITRVKMPALQQIFDLVARRGHVQGAEALAIHWDRVHGPDAARMDARVVHRLRQYASMTAVDLVVFEQERARLIAETNVAIGDALVAFPTTPHVAMPIAPLEADMDLFFSANAKSLRNTMPGNFLDWCGLSIPDGVDADAMPTGFLLSATRGRDAALLAAGLAIEAIVRG